MTLFSIKDLENFCGIKAHTIRTWELRFDFLKPQRTSKLRRTYSADELRLLLDISFLNRNGYRVSSIAKMNKEEMLEAVSALSSPQHKQQKAIHELIACMATMSLHDFDLVLEGCMLSWGVDATIKEIIVPFITKTGLLQSNDLKNKPALLLIEQTIRQKFILGIEKDPSIQHRQTALFIVSKKCTELPILYMQYLVKQVALNGVLINYPGSNADVVKIIEALQPRYIFNAVPNKLLVAEPSSVLNHVSTHHPKAEFINLNLDSIGEAAEQLATVSESNELIDKLHSLQKKSSTVSF